MSIFLYRAKFSVLKIGKILYIVLKKQLILISEDIIPACLGSIPNLIKSTKTAFPTITTKYKNSYRIAASHQNVQGSTLEKRKKTDPTLKAFIKSRKGPKGKLVQRKTDQLKNYFGYS